MYKKYNSIQNQKYSNNYPIINLKSTSQKINSFKEIKNNNQEYNNKDKESKSIEVFVKHNNGINLSQIEKSSNNNQNILNDEFSLDNISNIIEPKKHKLINNTQMIFEDNNSSKVDNNNFIPRLTNLSNSNSIYNNNIKVYDNYTKSFHLKMKKMKEMNKTIIKKNKIMNDSNRSDNTYKSSNINNLKSIIKCKQNIIDMKNKSKFIGNINGFNSFKVNLLDNSNNSKLNKNKEIKVNKTTPFLCCSANFQIN